MSVKLAVGITTSLAVVLATTVVMAQTFSTDWSASPSSENLVIGNEVTIHVTITGVTFDGLDLFMSGPVAVGPQTSPAFVVLDASGGHGELCQHCWVHFDVQSEGETVELWYRERITRPFLPQQFYGIFRANGNSYILVPTIRWSYYFEYHGYLPFLRRQQ